MKIYIRNMACESCKLVVRDALLKLKLHPVRVELGEAETKEEITPEKKEKLNTMIQKVGLEIIENKGSILIEKMKACIVEYINDGKQNKNFSDYLSKKLKYDYNYLSNIFSDIEACTITHYMNTVRMERAKELILFEDLTLSEIAEKLHYTNLSNFSSQFKKVCGLSPSHFKKLKDKRRFTMQELKKTDKLNQ